MNNDASMEFLFNLNVTNECFMPVPENKLPNFMDDSRGSNIINQHMRYAYPKSKIQFIL